MGALRLNPEPKDYGIGEVLIKTETAQLASGEEPWSLITTLPTGTWVVVAYVAYQASANGQRRCRLAVADATPNVYMTIHTNAVTGRWTQVEHSQIVTVAAPSLLRIGTYQNSGGTLEATVSVEAVRIA